MNRKLRFLPGFAAVLLFTGGAFATELTPDDPNADPNGPPPMPPPMPDPGQPGSATPPPPPGSTEAHLQESEVKDNGIGLKLFYVQPEIGFGFASLGDAIPTPASANTDFSKYRSGTGPVFGLGVGGEFVTFQLGARLRAMPTQYFTLWNMGGEVMFQPGSGKFWPRFGLTVGYAWGSSFKDEMCGTVCSSISVRGLSVGGRAGVQYFVAKNFEVGADATLDVMMLSRPGIDGHPIFGQESSGTGVALAGLVHIGLHLP
ncbi:MAG: hypothetical protein ACXVEF_13385 [Polyangiales bacterium]